ncbi:MAG: sulfate/molybdate ABC transporter ATP-binding protein [Haliea sp.]
MEIALGNINKHFGSFRALNEVDLLIDSGELIALLGPSGSGKTTLLRIIAGLDYADTGTVAFGGTDMSRTPLRERQIGFVFQHYALFKHMTVRANVGFGLAVKPRGKRPLKSAIRERADELLELVQLGGLGDRYPHQLSGGQRQRVALARALAIEPRVLLLDEPFGALDAKVRKELRQWLRELHQKTGVTTIFVTHDQEEALELADRIVIMNDGGIAQVGTVDQVYERPASPFVFDFLGSTNIIPARVEGNTVTVGGEVIAREKEPRQISGPADIYVRPGDLRITAESEPGITVTVTEVQRTGPIVRASLRAANVDLRLTAELPHLHHDVPHFTVGASLRLRLALFSVFAANQPGLTESQLQESFLIGRERARAR